jgi:hypothetical protein
MLRKISTYTVAAQRSGGIGLTLATAITVPTTSAKT